MTETENQSNSRSLEYDIVVVGGGMVGLTLALLIVNELPDIKLCLIESHPLSDGADKPYQPSFDGRSTALSSNSADLLDAMGLWQAIASQATPIHQVHISDRGHPGMATYTREENANRDLGHIVENRWLGRCLTADLLARQSITAIAPAQVARIVPRAGGASVRINHGNDGQEQAVDAALVIIADGVDSSLRNDLGIGVELHDYRQYAVIANVGLEKPHRCVAYERFTDDGPLALLPLGGGADAQTSALIWTRPSDDIERTMALDDDQFLAKLQARFGHRLGRFTRVGKRVSYPLQLSLAKEQVRSSVVLMGNAAHSLHPVAGQGFNLALRDSARLVSVLREAWRKGQPLGSLTVLNHYLEQQNRDQFLTSRISHGFNRVFSNNKPWLQLGRNIGLIGMELIPPLKNNFFSQMMGRAEPRARLSITRPLS